MLKRIIVVFLVSALAGCASMTPNNATLLPADQYLQLAANSVGPEQSAYQLLAAKRLLQDRQLQSAETLLNQLKTNTSLPSDQANQLALLRAQYFIYTNRPSDALNLLSALNQANLTPAEQQQSLQLTFRAYQKNHDILNALSTSQTLISTSNGNSATKALWRYLSRQSTTSLQQALNDASNSYQQGWLQLALLNSETVTSTSAFLTQIQAWQQQYPNHPANQLLQNSQSGNIVATKPNHIALLLPLSGAFASAGQSVKNGFFAAYYYAKTNLNYAPFISVYDTNQLGAVNAYNQAISDGANFVIGPLLKSNVSAVAENADIQQPTIALNQLDDTSSAPDNFYQLSLSPVNNLMQIATQMRNNNHANVALIAPNNTWGQTIANQFIQVWQGLGGAVNVTGFYDNSAAINSTVMHLLDIDQSQNRASSIDKIIGMRTRHLLRRRQDIDAIFVIADQANARQIIPLLRYYYAGNLPVFSVSTIYSGVNNARADRDLNKAMFLAMPWVLSPLKTLTPSQQKIRQQIQTLWPKQFANNPKLFALGVDSFSLINRLNLLYQFPYFDMRGATGSIHLQQQQLIRRLLTAQFRYGKAELIN